MSGALSDEEMANIRRELADNNGNLRCFIDDNRKMSAAVQLLFESCSTVDSGVFRLIVACTTQMVCHANTKPLKVGSGYYERNIIIDKLNEFISISFDGSISFDWADSFISYYSNAITKYNIKNINAYTKASILHYLYVDFPILKELPEPPLVEERQSSFDIYDFFRKSVDRAMSDDDYEVSVV